MKVLFVHSHIFKKHQKNYYSDGKLTYEMWKERYLRYFSEIHIAARSKNVDEIKGLNLSSGDRVFHTELPNIDTLKGILMKNKVKKDLKDYMVKNNIELVILRFPSSHALLGLKAANELKIPYVVEMVGDPFQAYWNYGSFAGKIYGILSLYKYKKVFKNVKYSIFVTKETLQKKYAQRANLIVSENISNVNLSIIKEEELQKIREKKVGRENRIDIALIGSYSSKYKGIDTAIYALNELNKKNINAHLSILGEGDKEYFSELIEKFELQQKIHFIPAIKGGEEVLIWLDKFDFYIQPSLTEGLPRALIEAMSRGLPSIATNVGGIPELLPKEMLINKKDYLSLTDKIVDLLENEEKYNYYSKKNYEVAKGYSKESLKIKRDYFWSRYFEKEKK